MLPVKFLYRKRHVVSPSCNVVEQSLCCCRLIRVLVKVSVSGIAFKSVLAYAHVHCKEVGIGCRQSDPHVPTALAIR